MHSNYILINLCLKVFGVLNVPKQVYMCNSLMIQRRETHFGLLRDIILDLRFEWFLGLYLNALSQLRRALYVSSAL
jgi:hypothetical protein